MTNVIPNIMIDSTEQLGSFIRTTRKKLNINQKSLAATVGITQAELSRIEINKCGTKLITAYKLIRALGLKLVVKNEDCK